MKLSTKPGRDELWLSIKICLIGISLVGLIGFVIFVIGAVLNPGGASGSAAG